MQTMVGSKTYSSKKTVTRKVAEKKIRDLQDAARTSLLHAIRKWPRVITVNLWPYAMRYANDVNNSVPNKGRNSVTTGKN